jgi:hypothetical protein
MANKIEIVDLRKDMLIAKDDMDVIEAPLTGGKLEYNRKFISITKDEAEILTTVLKEMRRNKYVSLETAYHCAIINKVCCSSSFDSN